MNNIMNYFLVFIFYSFVGWILEVLNFIFREKKIVNRGFLIGPYCPIYGFGSLFITIFLTKYKVDLFGLFVKTMFICAILEYLTSYIMERLFKTRWWDYSNNKFNINGRICLETMILFGIGGILIIYVVNPLLFAVFKLLPNIILTIISVFLFLIFLVDVIVSLNIINNFKKVSNNIRKDSTEEINKMVKEELKNKSYLKRRLVSAFPNFTTIINNYNNKKE